jgi:hypothetical protein
VLDTSSFAYKNVKRHKQTQRPERLNNTPAFLGSGAVDPPPSSLWTRFRGPVVLTCASVHTAACNYRITNGRRTADSPAVLYSATAL